MSEPNEDGYLEGHLLVAMPSMTDPRFERTVIYMCAHSAAGAMGLVINKVADTITFPDLLTQLGIEPTDSTHNIKVHFGGPVDSGRGFVLHSADYVRDGTLLVSDDVALTATLDVLRSMAEGKGPKRSMLALGYAGWAPGQLDAEIQANGWLHANADFDLVFDEDLEDKWERAFASLGIDPSLLSLDAGHA